MVHLHTDDPPENSIDQDGVKNDTVLNPILNCRIAHATTAIVVNNWYTTKCTLDIQPEKQDSVINPSQVFNIYIYIYIYIIFFYEMIVLSTKWTKISFEEYIRLYYVGSLEGIVSFCWETLSFLCQHY